MNVLPVPVDTPLEFDITSDAPMNSFWIPQLGGQIYAMSGMTSHLNLMASQPGDYRGMSANISGRGFADMHFTASAMPKKTFEEWSEQTQQSSTALSTDRYQTLAQPSTDILPLTFGKVEHNLYNTVQMKYTMPGMSLNADSSDRVKAEQHGHMQ